MCARAYNPQIDDIVIILVTRNARTNEERAKRASRMNAKATKRAVNIYFYYQYS